jgi:glyoxylase-like metal-dependent hydrolase (beta-lactamase superfamily II)
MIQLADGIYQIALFPRSAVNAYVVEDMLVDAGIRSSGAQLLREVGGLGLKAHLLTHAHPDHQGASAQICSTLGIPLWCGEADLAATESGDVMGEMPNPNSLVARLQRRYWAGPGHPVARVLREGDRVGEFVVLETPGHSAGHIALWRERDRALIVGDVLNNMSLISTRVGLHQPPKRFTARPDVNRESIRKVAALEPRLICFGHGPPLRDPRVLAAFVRGL